MYSMHSPLEVGTNLQQFRNVSYQYHMSHTVVHILTYIKQVPCTQFVVTRPYVGSTRVLSSKLPLAGTLPVELAEHRERAAHGYSPVPVRVELAQRGTGDGPREPALADAGGRRSLVDEAVDHAGLGEHLAAVLRALFEPLGAVEQLQ